MSLKRTIKDWFDELNRFLQDKKEHLMIGVSEFPEVSYGWQNDINKQYCEEHNIPYYFMDRNGGTIIHFAGNISLVYIYSNQKHSGFVFVQMFNDLYEYLKTRQLNVKYENNDILVDEYKVASFHGYNLKPDYLWTYEGAQISINIDLELIQNICLKPMKKIPKALSDYGIVTEDILNFIYNWFERNEINYE